MRNTLLILMVLWLAFIARCVLDRKHECERLGGEYFMTVLTCVKGDDVLDLGG